MIASVMENSRNAFSIAEIAARNGLSKQFVRLEIARGCLRAKRLGRRVVVLASDEREWLERAPAR